MSYFKYTDLISSFLDPRLVDPGSTDLGSTFWILDQRSGSTLVHTILRGAIEI